MLYSHPSSAHRFEYGLTDESNEQGARYEETVFALTKTAESIALNVGGKLMTGGTASYATTT